MKVLLLGITGNIGSRLAPALLAHGHEVVALVRPGSRGKINPELAARLGGILEGDAQSSEDIKRALLDHGCDAVVNSAGMAALSSWTAPSTLPAIFAAVVRAVVAARRERARTNPAASPIRAWFLSGWLLLDDPARPGHPFAKSLPFLYPEHLPNYRLLQREADPADVAWSLFCCNKVTGRYEPARPVHPPDCRAANLLAGADTPVGWRTGGWLARVPLVGWFLNFAAQVGGYTGTIEDCVDWIAEDLEKGLASEWIGKRVGLKVRGKA